MTGDLVETGAAIVHHGEEPDRDVLLRLYDRRVRGDGYEPVGEPVIHEPTPMYPDDQHRRGRADLMVTQITGMGRKLVQDAPPALANGTVEDVIKLGRMALDFGKVDRITYHPDGTTLESDTDHTVMLGLVACAFAAEYLPELDLGLVAQFAFVHDLVEVYAGDTPTLAIPTEDGKLAKAAREDAAQERIEQELFGLPWVANTIARYEARFDREARYIKAMDKVLPKLTHILNDCATVYGHGMNAEQLAERYAAQREELMTYASDFPRFFELRDSLVEKLLGVMGRERPIEDPAYVAVEYEIGAIVVDGAQLRVRRRWVKRAENCWTWLDGGADDPIPDDWQARPDSEMIHPLRRWDGNE